MLLRAHGSSVSWMLLLASGCISSSVSCRYREMVGAAVAMRPLAARAQGGSMRSRASEAALSHVPPLCLALALTPLTGCARHACEGAGAYTASDPVQFCSSSWCCCMWPQGCARTAPSAAMADVTA
jgi:hypothetical protein